MPLGCLVSSRLTRRSHPDCRAIPSAFCKTAPARRGTRPWRKLTLCCAAAPRPGRAHPANAARFPVRPGANFTAELRAARKRRPASPGQSPRPVLDISAGELGRRNASRLRHETENRRRDLAEYECKSERNRNSRQGEAPAKGAMGIAAHLAAHGPHSAQQVRTKSLTPARARDRLQGLSPHFASHFAVRTPH